MISRFCTAVALVALFLVPATAQTVRFDTNVGTFDMELNPTGTPDLQPHVDNLLAYVESGRYDLSVINRANENFVLQMGGFELDLLTLPETFAGFNNVPSFDNVVVDADNDGTVDFDISNLGNTRGTVSLALSGSDANSGTSSFFVNITDNPGLDAGNFIPFANITDMTTIELIMGLPQTDYAGGGLAGDDVPTLVNNRSVFVERTFVVESLADEAALLRMAPTIEELVAAEGEALAAASGGVSTPTPAAVQAISVPEPPALVLAIGALVAIYIMKPSKK